jgi:hypothetical protein
LAGAAEIDVIGGDEAGDVGEGALEFVAGGGERDGEGAAGGFYLGAAGADFCAGWNALAGGVVVEAERFAAESGGTAGVSWGG